MTAHYSQTGYQQASASGATHIGLLTIVYDALAGDLRQAGEAVNAGDISARCRYSSHALLLLAHLENWTELLDDPQLAGSLRDFYTTLRSGILAGQQAVRPEAFEDLAKLVTETRASWQLKEQQLLATRQKQGGGAPFAGTAHERETVSRASTWSA